MKARQRLIQKLEQTAVGRRFVREPRGRAVASAAAGLLVNLLYAFYHGALGVINQSLWFVAMLVSFGSMDGADIALMNGLAGISVCVFILFLGIFTVTRSGGERGNAHGTV